MKLSDFDFKLPNELIALRPADPRSSSKLLVSSGDEIIDDHFFNIIKYLKRGDRLVLNDTKVIPAKLSGQRIRYSDNGKTSANIGVNLLSMIKEGHWLALVKPAKRVNVGETIHFGKDLNALVLEKSPNGLLLKFNMSEENFEKKLETLGKMPLPPYIASQRLPDELDDNDYQTVFAKHSGSVAAPTASLHFDNMILKQLIDCGIKISKVTLHVGAGTFLPVKVNNIADHKMHAEWGEVSDIAALEIAQTKSEGGRIIPVGTTALRLIETAARSGQIEAWSGDTDIFITPGFKFNIADGLITNFHLPKSTLLMLVSALMGSKRLKNIYSHAIKNKYRFFSYGDASLLLP
ncbi:tRNA preQ1(34) S-adenosylmethionine ribosyltransferase-isomerase QueA [Amylibacter sp.]|nr:tRNA preQ1(34) S-adenosylmethionine ribosyltransferase-isomerase QueA [Amylibacter sp.]